MKKEIAPEWELKHSELLKPEVPDWKMRLSKVLDDPLRDYKSKADQDRRWEPDELG